MGFGILYGDGALTTADGIEEAYGYRYSTSKAYGMRGCFVYNKVTGKNLFFPIGASGYGHRKDGRIDKTAVLRYSSSRQDYFPAASADNTPLFYDLYMRPGAVYWLGKVKKNYEKDEIIEEQGEVFSMGWDFNYFTFDFFPMTNTVRDDACFVRCVEK